MRRILVLLAVTALTVLGFSTSAQAAATGTGTLSTVTNGTHTHVFNTSYTCNADGTIGFTFVGDGNNGTTNSGSGTGVLTPAGNGGGTFAFSGAASNGYSYSYGGTYDATGTWTTYSASDANSTYTDVPGSFTGIPDCQAPEPVMDEGNHGQCVSSAAQKGYKGQALAALAKDVKLVGVTCSGKI